jgi:L-lactate dehydrogenase (cytochrome)
MDLANYGNDVQFRIYQTMPSPDPNRLPVIYEEWEKKAREVLDDGPFYYIAGGAGGGMTMQANRAAFNRWKIVPRMLRNVEDRDTTVERGAKNKSFTKIGHFAKQVWQTF